MKLRILELEKDNKKIRGLVGEVSSALWGDMVKRDNGVRSRVNTHDLLIQECIDAIDAITVKLTHYIDTGRQNTCYGLAALAGAESQREEETEEEIPVTTANIQAKSALQVQTMVLIGVIINAIITSGCVVVIAFIAGK